jgi:hypothetical protein
VKKRLSLHDAMERKLYSCIKLNSSYPTYTCSFHCLAVDVLRLIQHERGEVDDIMTLMVRCGQWCYLLRKGHMILEETFKRNEVHMVWFMLDLRFPQ